MLTNEAPITLVEQLLPKEQPCVLTMALPVPGEEVEVLDQTKVSRAIAKYRARKLKSIVNKGLDQDWEKVEPQRGDVPTLYSRLSDGFLMIYNRLF
jgi:hypothetical protein